MIGPNQVSAPTPRNTGGDAWWQITPDIDGRLSFDALLCYNADLTRTVSRPRIFVYLYQGATNLAVSGIAFDPETALFPSRGQVVWDLTAGVTYRIRLEVIAGLPAGAVLFLRVSDYAPTTGWLDSDDVQVVTAPPLDMGWNSPLPTAPGYPGNDKTPSLLPTPVQSASGSRYIKPFGLGYGFQGSAEMHHYPQFIGDPGHGLHPYLFLENWRSIWRRAVEGGWTDATDWGPDAGESVESGFDFDGYWDNNRTFLDWPVGYRARSSAIDAAPPDGHQSIEYTVWAFHWHVKVTSFLYDYPGSPNRIRPWVTADVPDDRPVGGETWDFIWDADPNDLPTLKAIEVASNPQAAGSVFPAGNVNDGFFWTAWGKTLSWSGDADHQDGYWYQNDTPEVLPTGDGHDIYRSLNVVDGNPDFPSGGDLHGYFGPSPLPTRGEELASWLADNDDWHTVLDGEAVIAEYLALEAPGLGDAAHSPRSEPGELMISAIPAVMMIPDLEPDSLFYNATHDHASFDVFAALRGTYARPRHRWVGDPVIPGVLGLRGMPYRRGWPRHQGTTAARGVGGRDSIQDGSRGIGGVV